MPSKINHKLKLNHKNFLKFKIRSRENIYFKNIKGYKKIIFE